MFKLKQTCGACPEQYNVYRNDECVGFMHLRYGYFYVECAGRMVHEANTRGDGIFEESERDRHLTAGCKAIETALANEEGEEKIYEIEY